MKQLESACFSIPLDKTCILKVRKGTHKGRPMLHVGQLITSFQNLFKGDVVRYPKGLVVVHEVPEIEIDDSSDSIPAAYPLL